MLVCLNHAYVGREEAVGLPRPPPFHTSPWYDAHGHRALAYQGTDTALEWERNRKKTIVEYLPKLILVGLIWIVTVLVYM